MSVCRCQMLHFKVMIRQKSFVDRAPPRPAGELTVLPDPIAGLMGKRRKGKGRKGKARKGRGGTGTEGRERGGIPSEYKCRLRACACYNPLQTNYSSLCVIVISIYRHQCLL